MVQHCDDDTLALIALGESGRDVDERHVSSCGLCQSRVDQLGAVVSSARTVTASDVPLAPPASVWEGIVAELAADGPSVVSLDAARARRGRRVWLIAAAAAVVGIALGALVTAGTMRAGTSPDVIAQAPLGPVEGTGYQGTATVSQTSSGNVLTVSVPDLPTLSDGYYEVWMATPDTSTMVALGALNPGEQAEFTLPAGMDVASFPVVDVSVESFDGDPAHSATSVARGKLSA